MPRGVCWVVGTVSISGSIPALLAAFDLAAVRAVTGAINANLPKTGPLGTIPVSANPAIAQPGSGARAGLQQTYEPRQRFHPTPVYEARPVCHLSPTYESSPPRCQPPLIDVVEVPVVKVSTNPLRPFWETLPPVPPEQPAPVPKVIVQKVDVISKGTLLDLFV